MDILASITACALMVRSDCARPQRPQTWQPAITRAATEFGLSPAWVTAVMAQESGGRTVLHGRPIRSSAGAIGLMQVMPRTYQDMRRQYGLGSDPDAPDDNIRAGVAYLRQMYGRYGYPNMFAAYNAGPRRFDDFMLHNRPLPEETIRYVSAIVPGSDQVFGRAVDTPSAPRSDNPAPPPAPLFVPLGAQNAAGARPNAGLFFAITPPHS